MITSFFRFSTRPVYDPQHHPAAQLRSEASYLVIGEKLEDNDQVNTTCR
jgi:hypothetical protein